MTNEKKYNPLDNDYNERFIAIGDIATTRFFVGLMGKYEHFASDPDLRLRTFYWSLEDMKWQKHITESDYNRAVKRLKELGVLRVIKSKEAHDINGRYVRSSSTPDKSNYFFIDFAVLQDDAVIAEILPLYEERDWNWKKVKGEDNIRRAVPRIKEEDIPKYNDYCRNLRVKFKEFVIYLDNILPSPTESVKQEVKPLTVEADEKIRNDIKKAIACGIDWANQFRREHKDNYKIGICAPFCNDSIFNSVSILASSHELKTICHFIVETVYSHLIARNAVRAVEIILTEKLASLSNSKKANEELQKLSARFDIDKKNYIKEEKRPTPRPQTPAPKQEQKQMTPEEREKAMTPEERAQSRKRFEELQAEFRAKLAARSIAEDKAKPKLSFDPNKYSSFEEVLAEIDEEQKQEGMRLQPTQEERPKPQTPAPKQDQESQERKDTKPTQYATDSKQEGASQEDNDISELEPLPS